MPSAWNRTLSIELSPAGVYSVFAKVTDCLQSGCVWPPSLKLGPEVSSYYTRVHTFDDLFHFVSFRFVPFRFVPFRVLSLALLIFTITVDFQLVVQKSRREFAHARNFLFKIPANVRACADSRRDFWTTNWKSTVVIGSQPCACSLREHAQLKVAKATSFSAAL